MSEREATRMRAWDFDDDAYIEQQIRERNSEALKTLQDEMESLRFLLGVRGADSVARPSDLLEKVLATQKELARQK